MIFWKQIIDNQSFQNNQQDRYDSVVDEITYLRYSQCQCRLTRPRSTRQQQCPSSHFTTTNQIHHETACLPCFFLSDQSRPYRRGNASGAVQAKTLDMRVSRNSCGLAGGLDFFNLKFVERKERWRDVIMEGRIRSVLTANVNSKIWILRRKPKRDQRQRNQTRNSIIIIAINIAVLTFIVFDACFSWVVLLISTTREVAAGGDGC